MLLGKKLMNFIDKLLNIQQKNAHFLKSVILENLVAAVWRLLKIYEEIKDWKLLKIYEDI